MSPGTPREATSNSKASGVVNNELFELIQSKLSRANDDYEAGRFTNSELLLNDSNVNEKAGENKTLENLK